MPYSTEHPCLLLQPHAQPRSACASTAQLRQLPAAVAAEKMTCSRMLLLHSRQQNPSQMAHLSVQVLLRLHLTALL